MTWTPEQEAARRAWDLDKLDADPRNLSMVDPMDAVMRRRAEAETNGAAPTAVEPPADIELQEPYPGLIVSIDDYRASVPVEIPWRCRPLAYSGGVTLIAGPPKAGKSTLAAQFQRCCETGDDFLAAWPVHRSPALLVTEEGGVAVVHKTDGLHQLEIMDRRAAITAGLSFGRVLDAIFQWSITHDGGVVFIDTLAIWGEIENENDASEAGRVVAAVTALAQQTDLAILLVHHARKSGGDNGEAIRGSGAILATVDIAVEHSRVSPGSDTRWLDVQGRVILPERYLLSFDRSTMLYSIENQVDARLEEIEADLADIPSDGDGMSRRDIGVLWGREPRKRIEQLLDFGRLRQQYVKVGRSYAYRYWAIPAAVSGQWIAPPEPSWEPSDD